jgi:excisionase family DNA binding protein
MATLTTKEVAQRLGLSTRRVITLIEEGKLKARQPGREYLIEEEELKKVRVYGKRGRPSNAARMGKGRGRPSRARAVA